MDLDAMWSVSVTIEKAFIILKEPIKPHSAMTTPTVYTCSDFELGSISAPSLDHRGPSCVNVRGLDEESGARRDLFLGRLPLLNG